MNKNTYLRQLETDLKANNVEEIQEIIAEYEEHFLRRMTDGYTEEEIAAKLGPPNDIAIQFASIKENPGGKRGGKTGSKAALRIGLLFSDFFMGIFFLVMYAWVFVLGVFSLSSGALGVSMLVRPALPEGFLFIPYIPYSGTAILGISLIALGVLSVILTIYSNAATLQLGRVYRRWRKNTLSGGKYPPLGMYPVMKDNARRRLRSLALFTLIIFGAGFVVGYIVLAASAGAFEFWHVWNWFV